MNSDTGGELSPNELYNLAKFTETLHKIHTYVGAQLEKSRIKQFFRQGEMSTLLKACYAGLEQALDVFKVYGAEILNDLTEMQQYAQRTHQEVLKLITSLSDGSSDGASSISRVFSSSQNSSNSLSLLPSEPNIFHGRKSEISTILKAFHQENPRIAILGAGGMGKTSLSRAVLHHPDITTRFEQHRFFVTCDTVSTSAQLAGLIAAHIGLKQGNNPTQPIIRYFTSSPPSLLILDNLETVWEPTNSRGDVERFLALLTEVDHMSLIITMRGAERPANAHWTRPFLPALKPLPLDAARQTFADITDNVDDTKDIDKILLLTDNMPLAINLIAYLVDYEGLSTVLTRWEIDKTLILSEGYDTKSKLELSISVSLSSPRITSSPHARDLLSLLSVRRDV
ncbi:P-loop containing nucleoside triphosphate hydrolase protein [Mycena capillaripes]|nr:P-loop containing nucleoside triphosphate hydrolase protein [Mycena capillaripes]